MTIAQVWQFGDYLFTDYGVYVSRSSGVLDIPEYTDEGHDWLDEDGRSYWLPYDKLKKSDRDIVLNCWIYAEDYETLKTNIEGFLGMLHNEGLEDLVTPFGTISQVQVVDEVAVIRESTYVQRLQIGTFSLKLKVPGDSPFKNYLPVYDGSGTFVNNLYYDNSLKLYKRLQGDAYVTISHEKNELATIFHRNYYILLPVVGTSVEKYYLAKEPEIHKKSSNSFTVTYRFEQEAFKMKDVAFLNDSNESDFYYYASLEEIIDQIVENTDRYQSGLFYKGVPWSVDLPTDKRNHKFSGESCFQVLQRICEEYEVEYWMDYNIAGAWGINIAEKITRVWPVGLTLEYGKGNGLYEITREAINTEELYTVLYAYGANKNLKYDYGYSRLVCPGNPLEQNVATYGRIEKVKYFDDIYPAFTGTVTAYDQVIMDTATPPTDPDYIAIMEQWPQGMYRITATIGFDINDNLLGIPAKIWMTSGDLKGYQFEIIKHDLNSDFIFITPTVDEHAGTFPSATITIKATDSFTLIDTKQDEYYKNIADAKLLAAATADLADHCTPKIPYRVTVEPAFMFQIAQLFPAYVGVQIGDTITISDSDLDMSGAYRVSDLTYHYEEKKYELALSESKPLTKREKLEIQISNIQKTIDSSKANDTQGTQKSNETTGELRNELLDPIAGKLKVDDIVRHESIDPGMLAFDTGVPQFYLDGMMVEANYNDDPNQVNISSGYLTISNYYTESRYDIKKKIDQSVEYDPTRSWFVQGAAYTLSSNSIQFTYVKINLAVGVTEGQIVFDNSYIPVKRYIADGYLYYMLGNLTAVESPRGVAMLWGNVKQPDKVEYARTLIGIPKYGYLYNEDALSDSRDICAPGWHVPTLAELQALNDEVNSGIPDDETGLVLKSLGLTYWEVDHTSNDRKGFDLRGAGKRNVDGTYSGIKEMVHIGSTTSDVWTFVYDDEGSEFETVDANVGRVLRPIADTTTLTEEGQTGWYTGNDGKIYRTRLIYGVEWVVENVAETYFQDGSQIEKVEDAEAWAALESAAWCVYDNDDDNGFTNGKLTKYIEAKAKDEMNSVSLDVEVADSGDMPEVSNTDNVLKLQLKDKDGNEISHVNVGSMAAFKEWHGDLGDLPANRTGTKTIYYVNEEEGS